MDNVPAQLVLFRVSPQKIHPHHRNYQAICWSTVRPLLMRMGKESPQRVNVNVNVVHSLTLQVLKTTIARAFKWVKFIGQKPHMNEYAHMIGLCIAIQLSIAWS